MSKILHSANQAELIVTRDKMYTYSTKQIKVMVLGGIPQFEVKEYDDEYVESKVCELKKKEI